MIESKYLEDNIDLIKKLKQMPAMETFEEKDIEGLLKLSKIRQYRPKEIILAEGSFDSWIYYLVAGKVKIVKHGKILNILKRTGDLFGEMGVIDGSVRSASVFAETKTTCLAMDTSYIDCLSGQEQLAFSYLLFRIFAEILANRLRLTSEELVQMKERYEKLELAQRLQARDRELTDAKHEIVRLKKVNSSLKKRIDETG